MLSIRIKPISSGSNAAKYYFAKDNYYFSSKLETSWQGEASNRLGLKGEVKLADLEKMLNGRLPNGVVVGNDSHRCGYDLTFCASKSHSYLALVCGKKEFIEIHNKGVKTVLNLIQEYAAEARKTVNGDLTFEKTKNLSFATINHDTSRDLDPFLHTHALLMNLTQRLDGEWRALASDISQDHGTMEWISKNKIFLGMVYRSVVAMGIKELGLEIEKTGDPHSLFEIKHFDKAFLKAISKRRNSIEKEVDTNMNSTSLKAYDRATQVTRKAKKIVNGEELLLHWIEESKAHGINPETYFDELVALTKSKALESDLAQEQAARTALSDAIEHLTENKLQFSYQELFATGLIFSIGECGPDSLLKAIDQEIKEKNIIALDNKETVFTTKLLIEKESALIAKLANFPMQKRGVALDEHAAKALSDNSSIQKAISQALFFKDSVVRITQQNPTSHELVAALYGYSEHSKNITILTPTQNASNLLNEKVKRKPTLWQWLIGADKLDKAQTLAGFNYRNQREIDLLFSIGGKECDLLIVDDVQRATPEQLDTLLAIAARRKAKVLLIEKPLGLQGFKSDISTLLDKAKVRTFKVDDKIQKNLKIDIQEVKEVEERLSYVAKEYTSLSLAERRPLKLITISRAEADKVNLLVRAELQEQGVLAKEEKIISVLKPVNLSAAEQKLAQNYKNDWVIVRYSATGKQNLIICEINKEQNYLLTKDENGISHKIANRSLNSKVQAYEKHDLKVAAGDFLVTTAKLAEHGLKVGTKLEVAKFNNDSLTLKQGNKSYNFSVNEPLPLNYAYANHLHAEKSQAQSNVILTLPAYALRKNILELASSLSKEKLTIITDDAEKATHYAQTFRPKNTAIDLTLTAAKTTNLNTAIDLLTQPKKKLSPGEQALEFALCQLTEREAAFKETQLISIALKQTLGKADFNEIQGALTEKIASGELVKARNELLTTSKAIKFENQIINNVQSGKNAITPLLTKEEAASRFKDLNLTTGQKEACELIATTSDRFVMIQGYAGTGKTTMNKHMIDVVKAANNQSLDLIAIAPTHQAVHEIQKLGIKGQTIASFLIEQEQAVSINANALLLIDETSLIGNRNCARLVNLISEHKARAVLTGDISQHQAIEAGKPSALLLNSGLVATAFMDDIVRQKASDYRKAVETLVAGKHEQALNMLAALPVARIERTNSKNIYSALKSSVVEVSGLEEAKGETFTPSITHNKHFDLINHANLLNVAVDDYLSRTPECRQNTILVIHRNKLRDEANQLIRKGLAEQKLLGSENVEFKRLRGTRHTTAELYQFQTYVNCLHNKDEEYAKDHKGPFILKKDDLYFKVAGVDENSKIVHLQGKDGKEILFLPEKVSKDWRIELFTQLNGPISTGDKIQFKKTDKTANRFANEKLTVTTVSKDGFSVIDAQGKTYKLTKELKDAHWDYSYSTTSYAIQSASASYVIGVEEAYHNFKDSEGASRFKGANHLRGLYVTATRGVYHVMIYTNDYGGLKKNLADYRDKYSALEETEVISLVKQQPQVKPQNKAATFSKSDPQEPQKSAVKNDKKEKIKASLQASNYLDAKEISANLKAHTKSVVKSLLGNPNPKFSSNKEYRYGNKGSLAITLTGKFRGIWNNFETGDSGNLLRLIQETLGLDFKDSLKYATKITGDDLNTKQPKVYKSIEKTSKGLSTTRKYGLQILSESKPIKGTLAEQYLRKHRAILNIHDDNLRFHPNVHGGKGVGKYFPALLAIARDLNGKVNSIQAIYLDKNTAEKAKVAVDKRDYGPLDGAAVLIKPGKNKDDITYIAEGVETALSVSEGIKNGQVITTLGKQKFTSVNPEFVNQKVVFCLDNDGLDIKKDQIINTAISRLQNLGKEVYICYPEQKGDFNSIAKEFGHTHLQSSLEKIIPAHKNTTIDKQSEYLISAENANKKSNSLTNSEYIERNYIHINQQINLNNNQPELEH